MTKKGAHERRTGELAAAAEGRRKAEPPKEDRLRLETLLFRLKGPLPMEPDDGPVSDIKSEAEK